MATTTPSYPFDPTGKKVSNKITGEQHALASSNYRDYNFIVPKLAPFFGDSVRVTYKDIAGNVRLMSQGVDYLLTHWFIAASRACAAPIYGSISFMNLQLVGTITLEYQTIGDIWVQDDASIARILADRLHNPRITSWDVVVDMPVTFPPIDHEWDLVDMVGMSDVTLKLSAIADAIRTSQINGFAAHVAARNPHGTLASDLNCYIKPEVDAMIANLQAQIDAI
jgi:hypothetical protein